MISLATLQPYLDYVLSEATIAELPQHYRGKVRDNYDLPNGPRLLITSDRLSAFDIILTAVPLKGQVLNQLAHYWFAETQDICPNHVLAMPDPNVVLAKRLTILPVEMIVRGYLAGSTGTSLLTLYNQGQRNAYGVALPDGMRKNQILPQPIITPTSKAMQGAHDEPLTPAEILQHGLVTPAQWQQLSEYALALFARGQAMAAARGLILADTKYEFGVDENGIIHLADEIHTPDSSRYWQHSSYAARFETGENPESFDKDFVRNWVVAQCDPYSQPVPPIPPEFVLRTSQIYIHAYESITGQSFVLPDSTEPPLNRIRRNLAPYFTHHAA